MISKSVLSASSRLRAEFQAAKPFKHLCIDDFLMEEAAERALHDFPAFDNRKAINEYGEVGRKAVHSNLAEISPFFADMYSWLFSDDFLKSMSAITGIEDLIGDPTLYGGGTHENLHGQALDPHVDFNYVAGGQAHRRVNLLVYLNKGWRPEWGGSIELHSNPREPATNDIKSFSPGFNRAVLFETNEYSWHGFPLIHLPESERDHRSRKCLSIYLYTRNRPAEEIAGTHGTFYVQRPLSPEIAPGRLLTENDAAWIDLAVRSRDKSIETYQKLEERLGRELDRLQRYVGEILAAIRLPSLGFALQTRQLGGLLWQDGFVSASCGFELRAMADLTRVELHGFLPERTNFSPTITIDVDGNATASVAPAAGTFALALPIQIKKGQLFKFSVRSSQTHNQKAAGEGEDARDLAFVLSHVDFV